MEYRRYWVSATPTPHCSPSDDLTPTDWFVFLSPGLRLIPTRSPLPALRRVGAVPRGLTLWDSLEVRGAADWTLSAFLDALEREHGVRASMVLQGAKMVYVEVMPMHAKRKVKL